MNGDPFADISWTRLRREAASPTADLGVASIALQVGTGAGPARVALGPEGEARLLLPIRSGDPFPVLADSRGIGLRDSALALAGRPVRFIDLSCRVPALERVFRDLTGAILKRLAAGEPAHLAVTGAVTDFRRLLLEGLASEITPQKAIGLVGELLVLRDLLARSSDAWRAWVGPHGARHDFRAGPVALEVRTTTRAQTRTIEVSALDQLLEPDAGRLFLVHQVLETDAGGIIAIPALVDSLMAVASDPMALTELLREVGYEPELAHRWADYRWSQLETAVYRVEAGFPRLTPRELQPAELPVGVSHFRYRVDLAAAQAFGLDAPDAEGVLQQVVQCLTH